MTRGHLPIAERRVQLVAAAREVARRDGIGAVTVRAVAEEAGVAAGVVHYCFADKRALLAALSQQLVDQNTFDGMLPAGLEIDPAAPPLDFGDTVAAGLQALWETIAGSVTDQVLTYEVITLALRDETAMPAARTQFVAGQEAAERMLRAVAAVCDVQFTRPIDDIAGEALAIVDGMALRWLVDQDHDLVSRRLATLADLITSAAAPIVAEVAGATIR